jgi:ribosomal protein S18 acetylase RimI-like enzyme
VTQYTIRPIAPTDKPLVEKLLTEAWGAPSVYALSLGGMLDASTLPGFLAHDGDDLAGLLTYRHTGTTVDIVTLNSYRPGAGTLLISSLAGEARSRNAHRIRVSTTNDNTPALRFYQRRGFHLTALHPNAVTESRRHKPQIPTHGVDNLPIRDELELELPLTAN